MELETKPHSEGEKLATLGGEILQDVQKLVEQHVQLAKLKFFEDWRLAKPLGVCMVVGFVCVLLVGLLSAIGLVFLLNAKTNYPLWICFAIVDGTFLLLGIVSFFLARRMIRKMSL